MSGFKIDGIQFDGLKPAPQYSGDVIQELAGAPTDTPEGLAIAAEDKLRRETLAKYVLSDGMGPI